MVSKTTDYKERRKKMISYLGGKCVLCECEDSLQFDHIDHTTKSFDISKNWSTNWERLEEELNKCQLLCSVCHKEKTKKEKSWTKSWTTQSRQQHGTVWSYAKYKCRCNLCKEAKREAGKRQRDSNKIS
jgi:hypothetical protein